MKPPYYADDSVTLYLGDCRAVLPTLGIEPDCVIADPPYGSMRMFLAQRDEFAAWNLSQDVVWQKQNGTGFAADRFRRVHEHALHWYRGGWNLVYHETPRITVDNREPGRSITKRRGRAQHLGAIDKGVWVDDGTRLMPSIIQSPNMWLRGAVHPTEKPVGVLDPLIRYACPPGGTVLDPLAGSGSTAEAARLSGRRAVLIEADERYCEIIARRLAADVLPIGDV